MKKSYIYYFYKYCIGGMLGILLAIINITLWQWEFWVVLIPVIFFDTFKEHYFNKINK